MFIPDPSDRAGLTVTWSMLPLIGNDPERVLHLTDYTGASPVMLLNDSLRGLGVPEVEHFFSNSCWGAWLGVARV